MHATVCKAVSPCQLRCFRRRAGQDAASTWLMASKFHCLDVFTNNHGLFFKHHTGLAANYGRCLPP